MRVEITPKYEYLRDFIERIPEVFEKEGRVIYFGRNLIKVMTVDGLEINIKRYAIPSWVNRVAYSFFRVSKGMRAFSYPNTLLSKGFETPEPIAYLEERKCGLIRHSYFISLQSPYRRDFYEFGDADVETCKDIVIAFARYTANLHKAGILHRDYSPGNILFDQVDGEYHFMLVDINRMRFGLVNVETGCANFARLWGQKAFFNLLAREYAHARNADEAFCVDKVFAYRKRFWIYFSKKYKVKYKLEL